MNESLNIVITNNCNKIFKKYNTISDEYITELCERFKIDKNIIINKENVGTIINDIYQWKKLN